MSYVAGLNGRLAAGAARLPEALRRRHRGYLAAAQRPDGGFAGREGPSDLYYTGFALRGLALLDGLTPQIASRAADFLKGRLGSVLSGIELVSLAFGAVLVEGASGIDVFAAAGLDRQQAVARCLAPLEHEDGTYAKTPSSRHSSTYQTFLAVACKQLLGIPIQKPARLATAILQRQRPDGGFAELDGLPAGATSPTAAAVGLLRLLAALDEPVRAAAARFLAAMQGVEGGLRANTRIPLADLLSTFAGLVGLDDLGAFEAVDLAALRGFASSLELPNGGFRAGAWDDRADVEYTFYGLGTLALLALAQA
ncbi:MAG: prenyltransferase/squalene oxidase repeat-containing protein [Thermoguttaceae bacterium]